MDNNSPRPGIPHFNMAFDPFLKQSLKTKDFFPSNDHMEMISRLNHLKKVNGLGVFTALPGLGKSFSLHCFKKSLNDNLHQMHYICMSTVSVSEFYRQFCDELKLPVRGGKAVMFKALQEYIFHLYKEKRCPLIIAIDEAQYLHYSILKDLKMLMNHQYDSLNCFALILCGESRLIRNLSAPINEALRQRIAVHYSFNGLDPDEVTRYIHHKISLAGGAKEIVGTDALQTVVGFCEGNPRIIDNLMSKALMLAVQLGKNIIDSETIMAATHAQALI